MACSHTPHNCISSMTHIAATIHRNNVFLSFCAEPVFNSIGEHGIQKYVAHFSPTQLHFFTFAENTKTLGDIIWAVR